MRRAEDLQREISTLSLQQAIASGRTGMLSAPVVVALVAAEMGWLHAAAWALALVAYLGWRNRLLVRSLQRVTRGLQAGPTLFLSTLGVSLLLGAFAYVAFHYTNYEGRLVLSLVLCCWAAAAMLSSGMSARLYALYLAGILGGLASGWLATGGEERLLITGSLGLFGLVLFAFSVNFTHRVEEGIAIRSHNAELVRQLAAANEAKTRFLMAASHDLRQPLHAIGLMGAGLLRLKDADEIRSLSATLASTVENLNQMFSAILDISRLDSDDQRIVRSVFSLDALLAQLDAEYRALCLAADRRWECQVESIAVCSDPVQLERLLRNLLDNAVKHGGRGAIRLSVARENGEAVLAVADTGPGIATEERDRVFDEFYRSGDSGLGLGLSIVRRLVDKLGARLDIGWTDEDRRVGACFTIRLPAAPVGAPMPVMDEPDVDLSGLAVLVLDDDPSILQATQTLLRSWGCRVATCSEPAQLPAAVAQLGEPEVALIDYQLRDGVLGVDAIAGTQAAFPGMSTLIITGESDPARIEQLKDLGFLLPKPLSPDALQRALAGVRSASG
ncbi:ATP-binding response regulator [Ramlibacter sp.]|uniref:ATP-binding response regulator n=1 Tax=Ramlibacter sp. TaxID=1917967 RepID=UPI002FC6258C